MTKEKESGSQEKSGRQEKQVRKKRTQIFFASPTAANKYENENNKRALYPGASLYSALGEKKSFQDSGLNPYAPPRTLGSTEAHFLAMDQKLASNGVYKFLEHISDSGMGVSSPHFLGYAYLSGLCQNGLIRAGVETMADEMSRNWIELSYAGKKDEIFKSTAGSAGLVAEKAAGSAGLVAEKAAGLAGLVAGKADLAGLAAGLAGLVAGKADLAAGSAGLVAEKSDPAGPDSNELLEHLRREMKDFKLQQLFNEAAQHNGFFGGCLAFIDIANTSDLDLAKPLVLSPHTFEKGSLRGFRLIEPINVCPGNYNSSNPLRADYFKPDSWMILGKRVHSSRFLYFVDNEPPLLLKPAYNFFGIPTAQIALDYLAHFTESRSAASRLLTKFSDLILKTNMSSILQGGSTEDLDRRIMYMAQNRSNDGVLRIDKEEEEIVKLETPLGGVTDIVQQALELLAAIFRMPTIKLLGVSPGGLNATGESDLKNHYDNVLAQQEKQLRSPLDQALNILQMNAFGKIYAGIDFKFIALCREDEEIIHNNRKTKVETISLCLDKGLISKEEARSFLEKEAFL